MITVKISTTTNPRGPGFWKLNTNFLTESEYIELIRKTIQDVSKEYKEHRLEKRHFNSKTIRNLKTENNIRISVKDAEILQEAKTFYESLYSSKIDLSTSNEKEDSFFPEKNNMKLS